MSFDWTDRRVAQLKEMWKENGNSASRIAVELGRGLSRNAVLGKLARLGLTAKDRKNRRPVAPRVSAPRPRRVPSPHGNANKISIQGRGKVMELHATCEPFEAREADVVPLGIGLMELTEETCRWPEGDRPPFKFCGHMPVKGLPYCAAHSRIAYNAPANRQNYSEEELERRRQQGRANYKKRAVAEAER
jgi:GcrA cell cycle regulator